MKLKIAAVLMIAALPLLLPAQSVTQVVVGAKQNSWLVEAVYLANSPTDLLVADTYVCFIQLTNEGADTAVTIKDKQGSPVAFLAGPTISSKQTWVVLNINPATGPCRKFKGGITASAGTTSVSIYMSGVQ